MQNIRHYYHIHKLTEHMEGFKSSEIFIIKYCKSIKMNLIGKQRFDQWHKESQAAIEAATK